MNTDRRTGCRHGKFPAEELLTKVMLIAQVEVRHGMAVGFQRRYLAIECVIFISFKSQVNEESIVAISFGSSQVFVGHWHDALAIFARALGDELFGPRGKSGQRRRAKKCDFVAFYQRQFSQSRAEDQARIFSASRARTAGLAHAPCARKNLA